MSLRDARRPTSAMPASYNHHGDSPLSAKQNGILDLGHESGMHSLNKASLYLLGEKTQMKVGRLPSTCWERKGPLRIGETWEYIHRFLQRFIRGERTRQLPFAHGLWSSRQTWIAIKRSIFCVIQRILQLNWIGLRWFRAFARSHFVSVTSSRSTTLRWDTSSRASRSWCVHAFPARPSTTRTRRRKGFSRQSRSQSGWVRFRTSSTSRGLPLTCWTSRARLWWSVWRMGGTWEHRVCTVMNVNCAQVVGAVQHAAHGSIYNTTGSTFCSLCSWNIGVALGIMILVWSLASFKVVLRQEEEKGWSALMYVKQ